MEDEDTPLRTPIEVTSDMAVEIASKEYFVNQNMLEIDVIVTEKGNGVPVDLGVETKEKTDTKAEFKQEIVKITDQYYVLFIHDLPKNWKSVSFQFFDQNKEKTVAPTMKKKLYVAQKATKNYDVFSAQKEDFYEAKYIHLLLKDAEKRVEEEKETIKKATGNQKKMKEKIESVQKDFDYKTEEQQAEGHQKIGALNAQIDALKKQTEESEKQIKEQQEHINKLTEKESNLVY